ncbi:MAG: HAMP domain-containing protein [Actinomycetia bacterium]|nr:HAMP domain-containing protein [Actinomycetes bacterium]
MNGFVTELRRLSPRKSIRTRLTLISAIVLLVGLSLGAIAFGRLLENRLVANLDQTLVIQATDRAAAVDQGIDPTSLAVSTRDETAVAIFGPRGEVLASGGFASASELSGLPDGASTQSLALVEEGEDEIEQHRLRVAVARTESTMVVVASELEDLDDTLSDAAQLLIVGVPVITLAGAALVWMVADRSLRPVERLRRDAEEIASVGADRRVGPLRSDDEIGRLAQTLNEMLARLEAGTVALRRFVSDASHEIRSPVANIRARVETGDSESWAAISDDVIVEVERVETIVDDLSYLARSDEGQVVMNADRVEIDDLLFSEAGRLQARGRVTVDAGGVEPLVVVGDPIQLSRVLRNLVDNAERHADSRVALAAHQSGAGAIEIVIADDGQGIPVESRDQVFERFARLDSSRQRTTGGTGLGLAIVRDIVERHGGEVNVGTSDLGGARFTVLLPAS